MFLIGGHHCQISRLCKLLWAHVQELMNIICISWESEENILLKVYNYIFYVYISVL